MPGHQRKKDTNPELVDGLNLGLAANAPFRHPETSVIC